MSDYLINNSQNNRGEKKSPQKKSFNFKSCKKNTIKSLNEIEYFLNNLNRAFKYIKTEHIPQLNPGFMNIRQFLMAYAPVFILYLLYHSVKNISKYSQINIPDHRYTIPRCNVIILVRILLKFCSSYQWRLPDATSETITEILFICMIKQEKCYVKRYRTF